MNATIKFFINQALELSSSDIQELHLGKFCGSSKDIEQLEDMLDCYYQDFQAGDEVLLVDKIIQKLSEIHTTTNLLSQNSTNENHFSRIMISFDSLELEEMKINFTSNPHAQHIHIFNRNRCGMIRIKELKFIDLLHRSIVLLNKLREEL